MHVYQMSIILHFLTTFFDTKRDCLSRSLEAQTVTIINYGNIKRKKTIKQI